MQVAKTKLNPKRVGRPLDADRERIIHHFERGIALGKTISAIAKDGVALLGFSFVNGKAVLTLHRHLKGAPLARIYRRYRQQNRELLEALSSKYLTLSDGQKGKCITKRLNGICLLSTSVDVARLQPLKRGRPKKRRLAN